MNYYNKVTIRNVKMGKHIRTVKMEIGMVLTSAGSSHSTSRIPRTQRGISPTFNTGALIIGIGCWGYILLLVVVVRGSGMLFTVFATSLGLFCYD